MNNQSWGVPFNLNPGELVQIGKKLYGRCIYCGGLVRVNKPLIGALHICDPEETPE